MSKQHTLFELSAVTDWQRVYAAASDMDRAVVDFVRANPGAMRGDIVRGTGIPGKTLDFRLWELAGRSSGPARADGLLLATWSAAAPELPGYWRYHAREW